MAKDAQLLRAYLAVGADQLKRESAVKRLKGRLDEGLADFNLDEREASGDTTPEELIASLDTMPFGEDYRFVIIHAAEKLPKPASEAIVSYLDDPNPSTVLLLDCESLAKNTRLYKAVAKQGKSAVIDCTPVKRWELPKYAQDRAALKNLRLTADAAEELVDRVGESTVMIDTQINSLLEHLGAGAQVRREDVASLVAYTAEVKPWPFLDAMAARDVAKALELYRLMPADSQVSLLSLLNGRVRELIVAKDLDRRGQGYALASELGRQDWQVKNHLRWAALYADGELEAILDSAAECESALKGSKDSEIAFMEHLMRFAR